jgi:serum/glucocorticoid-regulated kinase 2
MGKKLSKERNASKQKCESNEVMGEVLDADVKVSVLPEADDNKVALEDEFTHLNNKALKIDDFELLKVLGKGAYGKVMLCQRKNDEMGTLFAMKTLRKAALAKKGQLAHTSTERYVLQYLDCPFLTHLIYAFQTPDKLYMVLEYLPGGELFFWLKKEKKFKESRVQLYAAELTSALEAMHSADIVYRDMKPENVLFDADGHIRLTDFGLAKGGVIGDGPERGTKTFCGTPEYLAPEILENKGHGKAVDWWALGTLTYEMLFGLPPFFDTNVQRMYSKILHDTLRFPKADRAQASDAAKDMLRQFLTRRIPDRLGSGLNGPANVKSCSFFDAIDFNLLNTRSIAPEFVPPPMRSETDVRNFDQEFTREKAADSMVVHLMSPSMEEKTKFEGFTYGGDLLMS